MIAEDQNIIFHRRRSKPVGLCNVDLMAVTEGDWWGGWCGSCLIKEAILITAVCTVQIGDIMLSGLVMRESFVLSLMLRAF